MKVQLYEWLYSHDGSYLYIPCGNFKAVEFEAKSVELNTASRSTQYITASNIEQILYYDYNSSIRFWMYRNNIEVIGAYKDGVKIKFTTNGFYVNDEYVDSYENLWGYRNAYLGDYMYLFDMQETRLGNVSGISYVKTDTLHLRPCKLLSPYQSHPAGECCMIDVLSNTLYFNQGTGAFSVEGEAGEIIDTTPVINNIISKESKVAVRLREWIKSNQGGQQINVDIPLNSTTPIKARLMLNMSEQYPHNGRHFLCLDGYNFAFYGNGVAGSPIKLSVWSVYSQFNKSYDAKNGATEVEIYSDRIISEFGNYTINASKITYILQQHIGDEQCKECIVGEIIGDNIHLHPCELALPYENHPIGECCMIDLNSGTLYFNQGSGQFSCEGAFLGYWQDKPMTDHYCDVEGTLHRSVQIFADAGDRLKLIWEKSKPWTEHRWIWMQPKSFAKLSVSKNTDMLIPLNVDKVVARSAVYSLLFMYDGIVYNELRLNIDYMGNYWYSTQHNNKISGGTYATTQPILHIDSTRDTNNDTTIKLVDGELSMTSFFKDGELSIGNDFYLSEWYTAQNLMVGTITIDGHTLTPSVLSRPTLAEEDNNNIARKQGECVFVDYQRYKQGLPWCFGNVASSGSFSVSDYLIEGEDFERVSGVKGGKLDENNASCIKIPFGLDKNIDVDFVITESTYTPTQTIIFGCEYPKYEPNTYQGGFDLLSLSTSGTLVSLPAGKGDYSINLTSDITSITLANGAVKSDTRATPPNVDWFVLFGCRRFNELAASDIPFVVKSFKISEGSTTILNLIPVRLLRTIEPTCTHNGKGGKVGEIGFFDTISGRFYGNDGSGEFSEYVP